MFERIFEIIIYVISELKTDSDLANVDIGKLENLGYSSSEISTAFSWLADKIAYDVYSDYSNKRNISSLRVFDDFEKELFTKDALGELTQLNKMRLVGSTDIEFLIERVMLTGTERIDRKMLSSILGNILFNNLNLHNQGSRIILNGSDTIN
jgi:uncharacterized protein Smg (DUF494 family)